MKNTLFAKVLLLSAITSAHSILQARDTQQKREITPYRRGHSGKYELVVPSTELGDQFNTLLNALWNALLPIIADAEQSQSHPSVAYRTFFKDKANAPFVAQLLRNVTIGNAMYPPMPPDSSGSPTLIYVDENTPPVKFESPSKPTKDAHAICMAGESEGVAAFVATRLPYIIICPDFFNSRPALPSSKSCPRITSQGTAFQRNKRLEPDYAGQRMMESQIWILLEEIVHYYLDFHWPTVQGPEPEVRDINRAWGLDAALSLGNAQSYAYYAATLHGKCNRWPTKPADDGRELREVEIDPDGPSVVGVCADQATEMPEDVVEVAEVEITGDMTEVTI